MIKKITIQNFLSIEKATIHFQDKGVILVEGINKDMPSTDGNVNSSNGAGKTALFEALIWCLYGKTLRKILIDDIIRKDSKQCTVKVEIEHSCLSLSYIIARNRGKDNSIVIWDLVNNCNIAKKDSREINSQIEEILGTSFNMFLNSIYIGLNLTNFSEMKPNQRLVLIEDMMQNEGVFKAALKKSKNNSDSLENGIFINQNYIRTWAESIKGLKETEDSLLSKSVIQIPFSEEELQQKIKNTKEEKNKLIQKNNSLNLKLDTHKKEINTLRMQSIANETKASSHRADLEILKKLDKCPTCQQSVKKDQRKYLVSTLLPKLRQEEQEANKANQEKVNVEKELQEFENSLNENRDLVEKLQKQYFEATNQKEIISIKKSLKEDCHQLKEQATNFSSKIKKASNKIDKSFEDKKYYDFWTISLPKIRWQILKDVIGYLNKRINFYAEQLNLNCSMVLKDKNIEIYMHNKTIGHCSSGEKRRVDMCLTFALRDLFNNLSNNTFNFLIIDEPFDSLDGQGINDLLTILAGLSNKLAIYVVSHYPGLKNIENRLVIVKEKGKSSLLGS